MEVPEVEMHPKPKHLDGTGTSSRASKRKIEANSGLDSSSNEMRPRTSSSSAPLPNLSEELITEILIKLPVKSLLKFKCVSKSWLSLISSPFFINAHLNFSTRNSNDRLVCSFGEQPTFLQTCSLRPKIDENSCVDIVPFDFPTEHSLDSLRIVGSFNGLVCLAFRHVFILWNPATRESTKFGYHYGTTNHRVSHYGFGYDASNDDYKVAEYCYIRVSRIYKVQFRVFSVKANSYRMLNWADGVIDYGPGVFVNGAIHWNVLYGSDILDRWDILALNITSETCTTMAYPDHDDTCQPFLWGSGGSLLASYYHKTHMDTWMLKEYGVQESWTKLLRVPYDLDIPGSLDCKSTSTWPLFLLESGGFLLAHDYGLVILEGSNYYRIDRFSDEDGVEAGIYRESLVSPHSLCVA